MDYYEERRKWCRIGTEVFHAVSSTAVIFGQALRTVQAKVERGTIRHVQINGRVWIPDFEVAFRLAPGGKVRFCVFEWTSGNCGYPQRWKVSAWRWETIAKLVPAGASGAFSVEERTISDYLKESWPLPQAVPPEYFIGGNFSVYARLRGGKLAVSDEHGTTRYPSPDEWLIERERLLGLVKQ